MRKRLQRLRPVVLVGVVVAFPLLYIAAVTLESDPLTIGALVLTGVVSLLAMLAF